MNATDRPALRAFLQERREAQTTFLAELVRTPSDNPPGDCAWPAARIAGSLEGLGFTVERHVVPPDVSHAGGMASVANLIVRRRFDRGRLTARNRRQAVESRDTGWRHDPYGAEIRAG